MMKANLRKQGEKQGETVVLYMNGAQSRHLHHEPFVLYHSLSLRYKTQVHGTAII